MKIIIEEGMIWKWRTPYYHFAIRDVVYKRKSFQDRSENWYHSDCYWMVLE